MNDGDVLFLSLGHPEENSEATNVCFIVIIQAFFERRTLEIRRPVLNSEITDSSFVPPVFVTSFA